MITLCVLLHALLIMSQKFLKGCRIFLLQESAAQLVDKLGDPAAVFLISSSEGKVSMVAALSPAVVSKGLQAGKFIGAIAKICGGGGGGRPNFAQAGAKDTTKVAEALAFAKQQLMDKLH